MYESEFKGKSQNWKLKQSRAHLPNIDFHMLHLLLSTVHHWKYRDYWLFVLEISFRSQTEESGQSQEQSC